MLKAEDNQGWRTDPASLREVIDDPQMFIDQLPAAPPLERVWILGMVGRLEEAALEGEAILAASSNRFRPLLMLAQVYQRQYRWPDAAKLQEEALQSARTLAREALVREQIGGRLFAEGHYRAAAAELEWAMDLYRSVGRSESQTKACALALGRAHEANFKQNL
jgi:tetratricopeptide (TPR) repeat protein